MGGFDMFVKYIVCIALLLCLASLYWILKGLVLSPVKGGENTKLTVLLEVNGANSELEHVLKGLIWLRDNGTLKADIEIILNNVDESTVLVAETFSRDYHFISYNEFGE